MKDELSAQFGNLNEGLGALRWGMSRDELRAACPSARELPRYVGRNPKTKEEIRSPEGFIIPQIVRLHAGVLDASALVDASGRLSIIELRPASTVGAIDDARNELAALLGVGPIDESLSSQSWSVRGCTLVLHLSDGFAFELQPPSSR